MRLKLSKAKALIFTATAAAIIVAAVAVLCYNPNALILRLSDPKSGREYASFDFSRESEFSVSFVHSVNKSKVEEFYVYSDSGIILTECIYYGFGAGVLTEVEPKWELSYGDGGEMIVSNMDVPMHDLVYIVGTVSDHILTVDGKSFSLRDMCGRNAQVRFSVSRGKFFWEGSF